MRTSTKLIIAEGLLPFALLWGYAYMTRNINRSQSPVADEEVIVNDYDASPVEWTDSQSVILNGNIPRLTALDVKIVNNEGNSCDFYSGNWYITVIPVEMLQVPEILSNSTGAVTCGTDLSDCLRVGIMTAGDWSCGHMEIRIPATLMPDLVTVSGYIACTTVENVDLKSMTILTNGECRLRNCCFGDLAFGSLTENNTSLSQIGELVLDEAKIGMLTLLTGTTVTGESADTVTMLPDEAHGSISMTHIAGVRRFISMLGNAGRQATVGYTDVKSVIRTDGEMIINETVDKEVAYDNR